MESDKLGREKMVDEFVNEIINREGNRGRECVALEITRRRLINLPERDDSNHKEFS